jgi:hypothetical protein
LPIAAMLADYQAGMTFAEVRAKYGVEAGATYRQVAERYGVSIDTVRNHLLAAGVTPYPRPRDTARRQAIYDAYQPIRPRLLDTVPRRLCPIGASACLL